MRMFDFDVRTNMNSQIAARLYIIMGGMPIWRQTMKRCYYICTRMLAYYQVYSLSIQFSSV